MSALVTICLRHPTGTLLLYLYCSSTLLSNLLLFGYMKYEYRAWYSPQKYVEIECIQCKNIELRSLQFELLKIKDIKK